jgi:MoaA/NifB/PqqE/SkfB family radical SAM enzyme
LKLSDWIALSPLFIRCVGKLPTSHLKYLAKQMQNENPHRHNGRLYINTFFPPYPSPAFDKFLDAVFQKKRIPYSTYFAVTDECPYSCRHCSYGYHQPGHLDTERAKEIIRQINSLGTVTLGFTGGEPLLRDDIVELVESVGEQTASIMFTTGHRLDGELAKGLEQSGLGCLMIGIESDEPEEHDKIRGVNGSFDEAVRAMEISLKAGIYTAISTVATREKISGGKLQKLAEWATGYGIHEFRILEPIPTGSFHSQITEKLSPQETRQVSDFHKQWNRKNRGPAIASFSYLESDEMFGCGAGYHHLFVDALGNVCPCDLTPLSFGNALDEPLSDIWSKMEQYFDLPRCGCLMKEICEQFKEKDQPLELPLDPEQSIQICKLHSRPDKLPMIYRNYLKDQE